MQPCIFSEMPLCTYVNKELNYYKPYHQGIQAQMGTTRTHSQILAPLRSSSKVDSTSHYKESTTL